MGDIRFDAPYEKLRTATDIIDTLRGMRDVEVIAALASASRSKDPYLANVLATEAMNRTRRSSAITTHLGEGVLSLDRAARVTLANPAALAMLRGDASILVGRSLTGEESFLRALPPPNPIQRVLTQGWTVEGAGQIVRLDGSRFDGAYVATPVRDEDEVTGAILLLRDETAQRATKRSLEVARERYELALNGSRDAIWDWNVASGALFASRRLAEMLGIVDKRWPRRFSDWEERVHPEDMERFRAAVRAHVRGLVPTLRLEHRLRHADGGYHWVLARGAAVRASAGNALRVAGSVTDIHPERVHHAEVSAELAELGAILSAAPDAVARLDRDLAFETVSESSARVLEEYPEDLEGRSLYELVPADEVATVAVAHRAVLESGGPVVTAFRLNASARRTPPRIEVSLARVAQDGDGEAIVGILRRKDL